MSEAEIIHDAEIDEGAEVVKYEPREAPLAVRETTALTADPYVGVAAVPFDERAQTALAKYQDVPDEWIDMKPHADLEKALLYLSHIHARNILNEAFGFGGWSVVPVGEYSIERVPFTDKYGKPAERVNVYRVYRLYVNGRFVDEALGAGTYYTNNQDADYSDACEAAKSYAINRLCKTFNIAQKCWNKAFGEEWKRKYARKNERGMWVKRHDLGAGAPQSGTRTSITDSGSRSDLRDTGSVESHSYTEEHSSSAPAPAPAPTKPRLTPILFKEFEKEWHRGSEKYANFKSGGTKYRVVGRDLIDAVKRAVQFEVTLNCAVETKKEKMPDGNEITVRYVLSAQPAQEGGE